jgi:predicted RNA binding protein YcfA (HicA-like mRNA interferase family)
MHKLKPLKPEKIVGALKKLGFTLVRQSGSHTVYRHSDGRWTTVPIHKGKDVSKGVLRKILKDVGLNMEGFKKYL